MKSKLLKNFKKTGLQPIEKDHYLKFFMLSTDAMCIADPFGCFLKVNPSFLKMTGYSEKELLSKPFIDFVIPEDRKKTVQEMKLQVSKRSSMDFENHYICKNGETVLLSWTAYYDKDDGVTYATARDITERRAIEEELKQKEEWFRVMFDSSNEGIFILSEDGNIEAVNECFAKMHGYTVEELKKLNVKDLDVGESAKLVPERMKKLLGGKSMIFTVEHKRKDGSIFPLEVSANMVIINGTKIIFAFHRDITKEKKLQEELENEAKSYQSLFDQAPYGIAIYDFSVKEKGVAIQFNTKAYDYLGYTKEEFARMPISSYDVHITPDLVRKIDNELLKKGEVEFETQHKTKSGEIRDVLVRLRRVKIDEKDYVQSAIRDVTEAKKMEMELKQNEEKFQRLIENATDLTTILDVEGIIRYESPSINRTLGYTQAELVGKSAFELIHTDDLPVVMERFGEVVKKPGIPGEPVKFRFRHKNGDWIYLESIGNYVPDAVAINGIVVNSRDVTKEVLAEGERNNEIVELEKFKKLTIGRELKMIELKKQIDELRKQLQGGENV